VNWPGKLAFAKMPAAMSAAFPGGLNLTHGRFPAAPYRESRITALINELPWRRFRPGAARLSPVDQPSVTGIPDSTAHAAIPPIPPPPRCRGPVLAPRPARHRAAADRAPFRGGVGPGVRNVPIRPACRGHQMRAAEAAMLARQLRPGMRGREPITAGQQKFP